MSRLRPSSPRSASRVLPALLAAGAVGAATFLLGADAPPAKKALTLEAVSGPFGAFAARRPGPSLAGREDVHLRRLRRVREGCEERPLGGGRRHGEEDEAPRRDPSRRRRPGGQAADAPRGRSRLEPEGDARSSRRERTTSGSTSSGRRPPAASRTTPPRRGTRPSPPTGRASPSSRGTTSGPSTSRPGRRPASRRTGSATVLNGTLDWVYEEELAHRNGGRSFEWSPDSTAIAYLRLDQSRVPEYPIVDFLPTNGKLAPQRYPCPGRPERGPVGPRRHGDRPGREARGGGQPRPGGARQPRPELHRGREAAVSFTKMDRSQTSIDASLLSARRDDPQAPPDGDRPGLDQLARAAALPPRRVGVPVAVGAERLPPLLPVRDGRDAPGRRDEGTVDDRPATTRSTPGAGRSSSSATGADPRERHVYRVRLDGTGLTRLTSEKGTHQASSCARRALLLDTFSSVDLPPSDVLRGRDGTRGPGRLRARRAWLADYALATDRAGLLHGRGRDPLLHAARQARRLRPIEEVPGRRLRLRRAARSGGQERGRVLRSAFDQLLRVEGASSSARWTTAAPGGAGTRSSHRS